METLRNIRAYIQSILGDAPPNNAQVKEGVICQVPMKASCSFLWIRPGVQDTSRWSTYMVWHLKSANRGAEKDESIVCMWTCWGRQKSKTPWLDLMVKRVLTWACRCWRLLGIAVREVVLDPWLNEFVKLLHTIAQICGHSVLWEVPHEPWYVYLQGNFDLAIETAFRRLSKVLSLKKYRACVYSKGCITEVKWVGG